MTTWYKRVLRITIIVVIILLIPLVLTIRDGGVEGIGWNWTLGDFMVMGGLLFLVGLAIELVLMKLTRPLDRIVAIAGIVLASLALWTEMAVGAVSQLVSFLVR